MVYYSIKIKFTAERMLFMALDKYLVCARVVGTHGVRGNLRLENHTDSPRVLASLKTLYMKKNEEFVPLKVEKASIQKEAVLVKLEGLDVLEEAITWKGRELYADRADFRLPRGGYFVADQLGLPVLDAESGEKIGIVSDIMTGRIQDIYVIADVNGGTFMVPSVPEFIVRVAVEGDDAGVYVKLIEGMRE